jgi:hypothetical protein
MKFSTLFLAIASAVAVCATTTTAFTFGGLGPCGNKNNNGLSTQPRASSNCIHKHNSPMRSAVTFLRMDTDEFAKSEIGSNDVSSWRESTFFLRADPFKMMSWFVVVS